MLEQKIRDLVDKDYVFAYVLHYFGISFYDYSEETLGKVCAQRGISMRQFIQELESLRKPSLPTAQIREYPVDLIIHYLRHAHYCFINQKLPYMARLIEDLDESNFENPSLIQDLKVLFPLFVEDFIHHIHEEEDTLFKYILTLQSAAQGKAKLGELYYALKSHSMSGFALDHHSHDDEMRGIREFTQNYQIGTQASLHLKVLFAELQSLERDLQIHAQIEDDILMVKAFKIECLVKEMLRQKAQDN